MKKRLNAHNAGRIRPFFGLALFFLLASCGGKNEAGVYTCPMHQEIVQEGPGPCPICKMELVLKDGAEDSPDLAPQIRSTDRFVLSQVETVSPVFRELPAVVHAQGVIEPDVRSLRAVTARATGRIERLYVRTLNRRVRRGETVYAFYSPALSVLQRQWLGLLTGDDADLAAALHQRLLFLGMSPGQLASVESTRRPLDTIEVASPLNGIVVSLGGETARAGGAASPDEMGMGGRSEPPGSKAPGSFPVREGDYVREGTVLFKLAASASRWAMLTLLPGDAARVRQGQTVTVRPRANGSLRLSGRIDLVEPFIRDGALGPAAHVHLEGAGGLPLNTLVEAEIAAGKIEGLFIPSSAVVDLGRRKIVWVSDGGGFSAGEIAVGTTAEGWVEVTKGLALDDEIAANAQYLSDSEAFIKTEAQP